MTYYLLVATNATSLGVRLFRSLFLHMPTSASSNETLPLKDNEQRLRRTDDEVIIGSRIHHKNHEMDKRHQEATKISEAEKRRKLRKYQRDSKQGFLDKDLSEFEDAPGTATMSHMFINTKNSGTKQELTHSPNDPLAHEINLGHLRPNPTV